jgi:hypothetical protein
MAAKINKPVVVHMDVRKLKPEPEINLPKLSKAKLEALVEEATVMHTAMRNKKLVS